MNETPVGIFFSYAHEDKALVDDVRRQLVIFECQDVIRNWSDRLIPPGGEWRSQIDDRLKNSDLILLFVSPHFFESEYCYDCEMNEAMRRHEEGTARVIPIILRPCPWESAPFGKLQALPNEGRPLSLWPDRDEACLNVAHGIMHAVKELRGQPTGSIGGSEVAQDEDRVLEVRVHRAFFAGRPPEYYFINLTNLSPRRVLEVTHVWYEDEASHIPVLQAARLLPTRLELDQSWETWIEVDSIPPRHRNNAFECFRAKISTGKDYKSKANPNVPPIGLVPGGPVC